jgi:hypothetical protein
VVELDAAASIGVRQFISHSTSHISRPGKASSLAGGGSCCNLASGGAYPHPQRPPPPAIELCLIIRLYS